MELFEKTLDSKKIFDGRVLHIVLDEVELPDGKRSKREVVNHPGGVCVAALDEDNNLSFVKQFRYPYGGLCGLILIAPLFVAEFLHPGPVGLHGGVFKGQLHVLCAHLLQEVPGKGRVQRQ